MKLIVMGYLVSLAAAIGCVNTTGGNQPASNDDDPAVSVGESEAESELLQPRASCSSQGITACLNGPTCHHEEGGNIGVFDCPSGTICCRF
jgi:hypothetical protein